MSSIVHALSQNIGVALVIVAAIGIVVFLQLQPTFGSEKTSVRRMKSLTKNPVIQARKKRRFSPDDRRRQIIADGMKQVEKNRMRDPKSIDILLEQSGLGWTKRMFTIYSVIVGAIVGIVTVIVSGNPYIGLAMLALGSYFGVRFYVQRARKKRLHAFIDELPNALDMLVRGVKAGLHSNECFRMIAKEAKEPVRSEFENICDAQALGLTISDAVQRMADRVPTPETNFLAIAISLQSSNGGRLSEAIDNLSKTLRDRKAMRGDIAAMSMEAKASTAIIGAMPILFLVLIYFSQPKYIMPLINTNAGIMTLVGSVVWMGIGLTIITKMSQIKV